MPRLSLIIPTYNAGRQLAATCSALDVFVEGLAVDCEIVIVDDHSTDDTPDHLALFAAVRDNVVVLRNDRNRGKGWSVARGMLAAKGRYRLFTDVDLAYPLQETRKLVAELEDGADVAIACRMLSDSQYLMSPSQLHACFRRHVLGRSFNAAVRFALLPGILDSQAGLKAFTAEAAVAIFSRARIAGFAFDVESLFLARRFRFDVRQVAVTCRWDQHESTVSSLRDPARMLRDIGMVRWFGWTNRYAESAGRFTPSELIPRTRDFTPVEAFALLEPESISA